MSTVSVVLTSYNQAEYVEESIRSVFDQTMSDWDLVIVDNGSTDGSHEILERWRGDERVQLILHQKNEAITKRLNEGIRAAKGRYISILYSDDYYLRHKLESQVRLFERLGDEYGVVHSPGRRLNVKTGAIWDEASPTVSGPALGALLLSPYSMNPISPLVRRECFERHPFREEMFVEGEGIFFRFAMTHRFLFDPTPTIVMRDHDRNIGRSIRKNYENLFITLEKLGREPDFPDGDREALRTMVATSYRNAAWQSLRVLNDPVWAREMLQQMLTTKPAVALQPRSVAALGLSRAPRPVITALNWLAARARQRDGHDNNVADYG